MSQGAEMLRRRRAAVLGPSYRLFYRRPLHLVRGRGALLYDADGVEYLDAYNNVPSVGHANPHVTEAVTRQLERINTNTRYLDEGVIDYSERLLATLPASLDSVMYACTGSEANDLALRIARFATGGEGIVVTANAYHGLTGDVARFSPSLGEGVPLGRAVRAVAPPEEDDEGGRRFAAAVAEAFADLLRHGIRPALMIVDSIMSSDGIRPGPRGSLAAAAEAARASGALFASDEVQSGFGRTGEGMWGFARHGVVPDIVTMGKPMANGLPLSALVARRALLEDFGRASRYFNTFGGSAVPIAAAGAVLDVIEGQGLIAHAAAVGERIAAGLEPVLRERPGARLRRAGLFLGIEPGLPSAEIAELVEAMRDRRVLVSTAGPAGECVKIRPPLVMSLAEADRLVEVFTESLDAVDAARDAPVSG